MMQIVYFSQKSQFLTDMEKLRGEKLYITPSPAKADSLRSKLVSISSQDVMTVAKFTSELMGVFWNEADRPLVKRKSELLLIFGIMKNKYLPHLGFEQFTQAYNLFSDMRSFSLNAEALAPVLEEQPSEIRDAVGLFWKLMELTGYLDEHGAYQRLAEILRSEEEQEKLKKTYIFWGFQHLNGQQIDLLKALSIRYSVIIPFPSSLRDNLKRSDWISWLVDHKVEEKFLPEIKREPKALWFPINSREIALSLQHHLESKTQIVLGVSKLSSQYLDLVPAGGVGFKIPHTLLMNELSELGQALQTELPEEAHLSDMNEWLKTKKKDYLRDEVHRKMPFKKLKVLQLFEETTRVIQELTDDDIPLDHFYLKLIQEVSALNQPRTSFVPLLKTEVELSLRDMSSLEDIDLDSKVIVCIDDRFDELQGLGQSYPENIQKVLSTLGPIKRNDLELLFKQWEFENLCSKASVTVLMPQEVLKHRLVWKKIFDSISLKKASLPESRVPRKLLDTLNGEKKGYLGSFSASRLQTYVDCPRKFYYSYVDKVTPSLSLEKDIDAALSGTIIHKLIEEYYKRKLQEEDLPKLVQEIFGKIIIERKLHLPKEVYLQRSLIFQHRSYNGINFLTGLENLAQEKIAWNIEDEFEITDEIKLNGKIDCWGVSAEHLFLLDFKSSKAAASTNIEIETMESLQLWVYALAAQKKLPDLAKKSIVMGYIVLDDPSESNLLMSDEVMYRKIKESKISRAKMLDKDFFDSLKNAQEKILLLAQDIKQDKLFIPKPRKPHVCVYCELSPVCLKGEVHV